MDLDETKDELNEGGKDYPFIAVQIGGEEWSTEGRRKVSEGEEGRLMVGDSKEKEVKSKGIQ